LSARRPTESADAQRGEAERRPAARARAISEREGPAKGRGSVDIAIERCKGCELCIPACPPRVLRMSEARNELGVPYPELLSGCTGCGACLLVCPDFCFEVHRFDPADTAEARP